MSEEKRGGSQRSFCPPEAKSFNPVGIQRVIQTASETHPPTLNDIGLMAADELKRLASLPPGESREAEIADSLMTINAVMKEKARRLKKKRGWRRLWT